MDAGVPTLDDFLRAPFERLAAVVRAPVAAVAASHVAGGLSGRCDRLVVTLGDRTTRTFVLKTHAGGAAAVRLGLAREALAYTHLASRLAALRAVPECYFAAGDLATGAKALLLEDVDGVDSGLCFGGGSPLNWGREAAVAAAAAVATPEAAARSAFALAARWHAAFWRDSAAVAGAPWLRGAAWLRGGGRDEWEAAQAQAAAAWAATERGEGPGAGMAWDPALSALVRASLARTSWAVASAALAAGPWAVVHGDFHPGNAVAVRDAGAPGGVRTVLLDLEVVGVGSGPQELAQYVISHMAPAARRACERGLVREYHDALLAGGVPPADLPFDACWAEYVAGGAARWVWFIALLSGMCDARALAYWQAQLLAFCADHGVTPDNIGQPRV